MRWLRLLFQCRPPCHTSQANVISDTLIEFTQPHNFLGRKMYSMFCFGYVHSTGVSDMNISDQPEQNNGYMDEFARVAWTNRCVTLQLTNNNSSRTHGRHLEGNQKHFNQYMQYLISILGDFSLYSYSGHTQNAF